MKKAAILSSKNQETIPREVRDALGLKAGEAVVFDIEEDGRGSSVTLRRSKSLEELAGSFPSPADVANLSWEEIRSRAWAPAAPLREDSPTGT
jgi:AbrB family looped-hinge helix DNA binding protein